MHHRTLGALLRIPAAILVLAACAKTTTTHVTGVHLSDDELQRLERAQSTEDWLRLSVGEPSEIRTTAAGPLWVYRRHVTERDDRTGDERSATRTAYIQLSPDASRITHTRADETHSDP